MKYYLLLSCLELKVTMETEITMKEIIVKRLITIENASPKIFKS